MSDAKPVLKYVNTNKNSNTDMFIKSYSKINKTD